MYGQSDRCWTASRIDYWQGAIVKCGRPGMACSATEEPSHDEGRGERSATRVHKSVTGVQNRIVTEGNKGGMASQFTRMYGLFLDMGM